MIDRAELLRKSQERRKRVSWDKATGLPTQDFVHPVYYNDLLDRWLNVHDIRAMGERAVEETT